MVGEKATPFEIPLDHVYVDAPVAINEVEPLAQITEFDAVTEIVGFGFTITETVLVPVQPAVDPFNV